MKQKYKKVLSVFLSIVMLFSIIAGVDLSVYAFESCGKCGENAKWTFDEATGTLTISGTGDMYDYAIGGSPFYDDCSIKTVVIENGITRIGNYALDGCSSLTSIIIPDGVTSVGDDTFRGCSNLTSVTIPNSVTSIGNEAFSFCSSLTSTIIPDGVTSVGDGAFWGCSSLTSITIPNGVTSIGDYAFAYCSSLTSVTIPDSVTRIGNYAFEDCTSLTSVTIPDSVTRIGDGAFDFCTSLISVIIPDSVISIGDGAFYFCISLTSVKIPNDVTSIGDGVFGYCSSLETIIIPDSVTSIGDCPFYCCSSLISINVDSGNPNYSSIDGILFNKNKTELIQYPIGNTRTSYYVPNNVTTIASGAFIGCSNLTSITVDSGNPNYSSIDGVLFNKNKTELIQYPIGNTRTYYNVPNNVTKIGDGAFYGCISIISVTISNSVTNIGGVAFCGCKSLSSITIPDSVTSIGDFAFLFCESLIDVYYGGTQAEWNSISIGSDNSYLINANIQYNYNTNNNYDIKLYSAMPALTIGVGQKVNCAIQLENNGIPVNGNDNAAFEISVSDSDILNVTNIRKDQQAEQQGENGTLFTLNGKNEGNTKLRIEEINTGLIYETTINVSNGILSFAANCMPSYYDHNFEYNGYVSGMYVDEFQYNESQSTLSFNVYNSTSLMGVVEVYDSNGNLINCELIDRFDGNYVSSIKDSVVNMYKLVSDGLTGELITYKQDSSTKKTTINNLYVPKGGRIEITNNCMYSQSCAIANATELTVESLLTFSNSISDATKTKEIAKDTVGKIIKDSIKKDLYELGNKITEKIAKKTTEEVSKNLLNGALSEFVSDTISAYTVQNIDLDKIIIASCKSAGIGVAENALKKAMGPAGLVLDGLFLFSDYADLSSFYISIGKDNSTNSLYIYMPREDNSLCDNGVIVKPEDNSMNYSEENYVVRSLVIEKDSTLPKKTWNELNEISNDYIVREIHIEKDGKETQPKGKMLVSMLIPDDYKNAKYVLVYWVKDDGTLEKLSVPATRQGDYLMFYVDHFSYYAIVSHNEHKYEKTIQKATLNSNGTISEKCACGENKSTTTIYYPKTIKLSATSYVYDGKVKKPSVTVKDSRGKIISSSNYTVNYSNNTNVGTSSVKVTFKGNYSGSVTKAFKILPKNTSISSVTSQYKGFTVKLKKYTTQTTGYQIQYSTSSNFTKCKTVTLKNTTTSKTITGLATNKKYYVRVRTYKIVGSTYYYSSWSSAENVITSSHPTTIILSSTSYTYNGKAKKPTVTVKDSKGNKISTSNYSVTYSNNKYVGKASVKVTFKGNYSGSKTLYFTINPKGTTISSLSATSRGFKVSWKKQATQTTGYQIQYSTSSKFTNPKTVTVSSNSTTSKTISKLSAKKKYYVRVRTYKTVNGTKYYSAWSGYKSVTTKK